MLASHQAFNTREHVGDINNFKLHWTPKNILWETLGRRWLSTWVGRKQKPRVGEGQGKTRWSMSLGGKFSFALFQTPSPRLPWLRTIQKFLAEWSEQGSALSVVLTSTVWGLQARSGTQITHSPTDSSPLVAACKPLQEEHTLRNRLLFLVFGKHYQPWKVIFVTQCISTLAGV